MGKNITVDLPVCGPLCMPCIYPDHDGCGFSNNKEHLHNKSKFASILFSKSCGFSYEMHEIEFSFGYIIFILLTSAMSAAVTLIRGIISWILASGVIDATMAIPWIVQILWSQLSALNWMNVPSWYGSLMPWCITAFFSKHCTSSQDVQNPIWSSDVIRFLEANWVCNWMARKVCSGACIVLGRLACIRACPIQAIFKSGDFIVIIFFKNVCNETGIKFKQQSRLRSFRSGYVSSLFWIDFRSNFMSSAAVLWFLIFHLQGF